MTTNNNNSTSHKCALVTGSSNGIGEAIVKRLAQLDYKLVVTGRNVLDIKRVAMECEQVSPSKLKPLEVVADLGQEADVEQLFEKSMLHFNHRLDLLVNNAGLGEPVEHERTKECFEAYKRTIQVNLNSAVQLSLLACKPLKQTASQLCQARPTSIVNIASLASLRPTQSLAAYSTSKAGLLMFSRSMASELGPLIRVNCICPGPIETKIIERAGFPIEAFRSASEKLAPLRRIGRPHEVAESVVFLANHDTSGFITGAELVIDGGCLAAPLRWDP